MLERTKSQTQVSHTPFSEGGWPARTATSEGLPALGSAWLSGWVSISGDSSLLAGNT